MSSTAERTSAELLEQGTCQQNAQGGNGVWVMPLRTNASLGAGSSLGVRRLVIQDGRRGQRGKNGSAQRVGTCRRQPVQVRARIKNNSLMPVQNTGADGVAVQSPARREALGERCATIMALRQQLTTALRRVSSGPGCWCRLLVSVWCRFRVGFGAPGCHSVRNTRNTISFGINECAAQCDFGHQLALIAFMRLRIW